MEKLISIRYGKFVKLYRGWLEVRLVDLLVGGPLFCRKSWRGFSHGWIERGNGSETNGSLQWFGLDKVKSAYSMFQVTGTDHPWKEGGDDIRRGWKPHKIV